MTVAGFASSLDSVEIGVKNDQGNRRLEADLLIGLAAEGG